MASLIQSLHALAPTIREICSISGVAGVSIGVIHHGRVLYKDNFGHRDVEADLPVDSDTIYYLGSMTKGFTAEAIGLLVEDGKLEWNTKLQEKLPEFQSVDPTVGTMATMIDFLSHRTGLERSDALWAQSSNNILLNRDQAWPTINRLRPVTPFRAEYRYNNWGFEIGGRLVEKLTSNTYASFLKTRIFEPLNMSRSFNDDSECHGAQNVAKGYMTLDDGTPWNVPRPHMAQGTLINPAGGIQSCVNDLIIYYTELMKSANDQFAKGTTSTPGSPLKQLPTLLSGHIKTEQRLREQSYALGWARVQLPGTLSDTSRNAGLLPKFMSIGDSNQPRLVLYHHGMLVGFNNAVYLFPETESAVILLSNSVAINDGPDLIGHLLIQTLFQDRQIHDFVALARQTRDSALKLNENVFNEVQSRKTANAQPRPSKSYIGKYWNALETFYITISEKDNALWMNFQGNKFENYQLAYLGSDKFTWIMPRNEQVKKGRNPITWANYWIISFQFSDAQRANQLHWIIEPDLPDGKEFTREVTEKAEL